MEKAMNAFIELDAGRHTREELEAHMKGKLVKCCFCEDYCVFGNNIAPFRKPKHSSGRCCDSCNARRVITARVLRYNLDPRNTQKVCYVPA